MQQKFELSLNPPAVSVIRTELSSDEKFDPYVDDSFQ